MIDYKDSLKSYIELSLVNKIINVILPDFIFVNIVQVILENLLKIFILTLTKSNICEIYHFNYINEVNNKIRFKI